MTDTPFLTVADVARLVVMTEPYVRDKLSRQRGFPEPYRLGNSLRWKREDIERWIESRKLSPAARRSKRRTAGSTSSARPRPDDRSSAPVPAVAAETPTA